MFLKKIPTKTFISLHESKAAGFKVAKDWVSLLLCANSEVDFMVEPIMLYCSLNPHALKNKNKQALPVYWRVNRKASVTSELFYELDPYLFRSSGREVLGRKEPFFKGTPAT